MLHCPGHDQCVLLCLVASCRLFAVSYATRQLTGLQQQPSAHAAVLERLQQQAVYQARDQQLALLCGKAPSIKQALQRAQQSDALAQQRGEQRQELWEHTCQALESALSLTDALATGQPELLAAVSGPRDLLIPPAQQKLQPTAVANAAVFQAKCLYLGHCPDSSGLDNFQAFHQVQRKQQQHAGACLLGLQQQKDHQGPASRAMQQRELQRQQQQAEACEMAANGPALMPPAQQSDVSQLMLQSPCPAEALGDPLVWWRWQQALLGLDDCDICGGRSNQVWWPAEAADPACGNQRPAACKLRSMILQETRDVDEVKAA